MEQAYFHIQLENAEEISAMTKAMRRALNTWDQAPKFLFDLAALLEAKENALSTAKTVDVSK